MRKIAVILLVLLLFFASTAKTTEIIELMEPVGVKVDTAMVTRGDLSTVTVSEGHVVAESTELYFEINGEIEAISFYPGQWVEKGEELMKLDQSELEKQLSDLDEQIAYTVQNGEYADAIAQVELETMRVELRQQEEIDAGWDKVQLKRIAIEEKEAAIRQTQDMRTLEINMLRAKREKLAENLDKNVIYAPFSGNAFYDATSLAKGSRVQLGKTVVYMCDPNDLSLVIDEYISPSAADAANCLVRVGGKEYEVIYEPMDLLEMSSLMLSGKSLISRFRFALPREEMPEVTAGMYAVLVQERAKIEDVLLVPSGTIYTTAGNSYVYVKTNENEREKRVIKTGRTNGVMTQIVDGLEEGESVYVRN